MRSAVLLETVTNTLSQNHAENLSLKKSGSRIQKHVFVSAHFIYTFTKSFSYRSECPGKGISLPVFAVVINNNIIPLPN